MGPRDRLDVQKLQRWALGRYRWDKLMRTHGRGSGEERPPLVPKTALIAPKISDPDSFTGVSLIPGGRYLVTTTLATQTMALWDLGEAGQPPLQEPLLVASVCLENFRWGQRDVQLVGNCIRIVFLEMQDRECVLS